MPKNTNGRPHPAIRCVETGKVYKSYTEAGKDIGRSRVNVMRVATGMQRTTAGMKFEFVEEDK